MRSLRKSFLLFFLLFLVLSLAPSLFADGPTGPQGQTPDADYEYTDANGVTHTNLSELEKAGLVLGGYVPVPDPNRPGAFVFVDPDTLGGTGSIGGTGGVPLQPPNVTPPPTQAPFPGPTPPAGGGGSITNNGSDPVTVQVKKVDGEGNESYEIHSIPPGGSVPLPDGSDYIRVFPGTPDAGAPNVDVTSPDGSANINEFNRKTPPPRPQQGAMAPGAFGDEFAMGPAGIGGGPLGSDVHAGGGEVRGEQRPHHQDY